VDRWNGFWFADIDPATLGLIRIAFGAVITVWTLSLAGDLGAFFARDGVVGGAAAVEVWWRWNVLAWAPSEFALGAVYLALLLASIGAMIGWHSRASLAVVFVALVSLQRTDPYVFNSGDSLLRLLALLLLVAPCGAAFSLDRRRALRTGHPAVTTHPAWPLRLIQIQVTVMYLAAVWAKLHGAAWRDGTAASYATRLPDLARFHAPEWWTGSPLAAHLATYGTIAIEASVAVLVWNRRTRLPALIGGVALHLSIDYSIRVGFFTLAVLTAYLSFVDPATVRAWAAALARRRDALIRIVAAPCHDRAREPSARLVAAPLEQGRDRRR
jgi:hypothetical protein